MNVWKWTVLSGMMLFAVHLFAQEGTKLKGIVVETDDKGNILPIEGAVIFWLHTATATTTDSNGVFYIQPVAETRRLVISYVGYKPDTILINNQSQVRVVLVNKNKLKEVDIIYRKKSTEISYLDPWKTTLMNEKELMKQACCNLAESFETNPSVDVSFSDAVTGTRQIQMLGLASQYTQVTQEYVPSIRGIATNYGFTYTPGSWLNSIQVSKGVGSVVNGFESISGLINTELHKSDVKDHVFFNAYASQGGRYETNLVLAQKVNQNFSHSILTHASILSARMDNNGDGFLDNPVGSQWNLLYRWKWNISRALLFQGGFRVLRDEKMGGMLQFRGKLDTSAATPMYGTEVNANRSDGWIKLGYVFPKKVYKSIGLQLAASNQDMVSYFGLNTYNARQKSVYGNVIYQSIIGSSDHKFRTGISNQTDVIDETFQQFGQHTFARTEVVSGGFFEYTYSRDERFNVVLGLRGDYNNLFGFFATPRLHVRYAPNRNGVWRLSAGRGQRTANVLAENTGLMASSRRFVFNTDSTKYAYGFKPEVAWNFGMNYTRDFKLNYRPGTVTVDYYYNFFTRQVVVDRDADIHQVRFMNLNGSSLSQSFQVQVDYEPVKRLDVRLAYRYYDIQTQYTGGMLEVPLISRHRGFFNLAYTTRSKWVFDGTWNINGRKRIPTTALNPGDKQLDSYSPVFGTINAQVTKSVTRVRLDVYVGVENLLNYRQYNPIIDAGQPYSSYFDASMVWGPLFGRMIYGGLRFRI